MGLSFMDPICVIPHLFFIMDWLLIITICNVPSNEVKMKFDVIVMIKIWGELEFGWGKSMNMDRCVLLGFVVYLAFKIKRCSLKEMMFMKI